MSHDKKQLKNTPSIPIFIKDIEAETIVFISEIYLKVSPDRKLLYMNPYGYASDEYNDFFTTELWVGNDNEYDIGDAYIIPDVAHVCPEGWISIPVNPITVERVADEDSTMLTRTQIARKWDNYIILEDIFEGLVAILDALARRNIEKITQLVHVKEIKKYIISRVQNEKDYIQLEPVLVILEDVIDEEDQQRPDDVIKFYKSLQNVVDQRLAKLMEDPKVRGTGELKPISEASLVDLQRNFKRYSDEDFDNFLGSLNGESSNADLEKAKHIRDHRQKVK